MIGRAEIAGMCKDAILVNVSRVGLIEEATLTVVLTSGLLGGAGLDVFENEPLRCALT